MMATENLQPQIAAFFPGNEVTGAMWRRGELRAPLADEIVAAVDPRIPARPTGHTRTTLIEGVTRGRAAPLFVTRLLPGLNLVEYPYERMVSFSDLRPDGSVHNDMVFSGKAYDMYIEGTTDADQVVRYQVGVILLGSPQSPEWNHLYKLGRIPILSFKARIVDGKKLDEQVSYPLPNQTLFTIFLKNNPFYRLWLQRSSSKSADGAQPRPPAASPPR